RCFRHFLPRMEVWATVVIMVEEHAMVYYAAVRRATGCPILRAVCRQILRDEVPHLRFQCERLAVLHRGRSPALRAVTVGCQRMLFAGVTLAVWVGHRRALRAGGHTFGTFWRSAWARMGRAWRRMDPRGYRWPAG
ncbi:MAG: ferritin-like domain-containing protein, partial [Gemmataceae bacterium]|nr:ferritin-like domain-containing protein [Gemmataceae bacterium]